MRFALAVVALAVTLTGCMGHPERRSSIAPGGAGDLNAMRADLRACLSETMAFELIPDFGITADFHRRKCMKERGWIGGMAQSNGLPDFSRVESTCPDNYAWNGNGCSAIARTAAPAWATGE